MTQMLEAEVLPAVGLVAVFALEWAWHFQHFNPANATLPLLWYLGIYLLFALFPFLFLKQFAGKTIPWAASALAGPSQYLLVYYLLRAARPAAASGLLPAAFAIPPLLGLGAILKRIPATEPARNAHLALFGGAALFFITLIFPVQFHHEWITISWALEGAALCWLFHRVPHPGLRLVGVALLVVAFARLGLNASVLTYHPRGTLPILNWYLYTYGIVTVAPAPACSPPRVT
jgi:hypothetical protein